MDHNASVQTRTLFRRLYRNVVVSKLFPYNVAFIYQAGYTVLCTVVLQYSFLLFSDRIDQEPICKCCNKCEGCIRKILTRIHCHSRADFIGFN